MKNIKKILLLNLMVILFVIGCSENPVSTPPYIPVNVLLTSPDTVIIEGNKIYLTTEMWRDFMPVSPPDGKPLITVAKIETVDSSKISNSINADAIYIVNGGEVWKSFLSDEAPGSDLLKPFRIVKIARDGPKWGPGINVDVVVRLLANNNVYLLRASNQYIARTD